MGVIGFGGVAQGLGLLPLQGDDRGQEGLEGLPVVLRPGALPGRLAFGGGFGQGDGQVLGDFDGQVVIPPPLPDVYRGIRHRVRHQVRGFHPGQGLPSPWVGGPDVNPLGQHGELVVAVRMPFRGDMGALVPAQHLAHGFQVGDLQAVLRQPAVGFIGGHDILLNRLRVRPAAPPLWLYVRNILTNALLHLSIEFVVGAHPRGRPHRADTWVRPYKGFSSFPSCTWERSLSWAWTN